MTSSRPQVSSNPSSRIGINPLVLVLYLYSDIKVDRFQGKVLVDNKVVGLDVPVSNTVFVKIREALDEAQADLRDPAVKLVSHLE